MEGSLGKKIVEDYLDSRNCLEDADFLTKGPRQADYGHPIEDFGRVTNAATALGIDVSKGPLHHALYMILVKIQRLVQTPDHRDSLVDIAGYARNYEMILERMEQ